jgi:ATP-dependent DNA helicase RecG
LLSLITAPSPLEGEGKKASATILTGSIKNATRKETIADIASGKANIIIGTHALFQEQVEFANLALIIIDEQHRFGVHQRLALSAKGNAPHILHMTATPIPRSLTMTIYGDMDCSLLTEKPAQRLPITTRLIPISRYAEIMERLQNALNKGEKIYWICPLVNDNSDTNPNLVSEEDVAAASKRHSEFTAFFGDIVGLVHGQMKADIRDAAMHDFANGKTRILVATTVVEVGVDVRDATIIVIEKAERFGLSQLHQLRGRVGRGDKPSSCVLLFSDNIGEIAKSRLSILRETEDGFRIAEADLAIRGGGELLGTKQSGMPRFIFTNLSEHQELLTEARADAAKFLATPETMAGERGKALELLLQLFGYK